MSAYVGLAIGLVGALLQATILADYRVAGVHPDLVLLAVIGWAALHRMQDGLLWASLGGLSTDLASAGAFGGSVVAMIAAALIGGAIGRRVRRSHPFLAVLAVPFAAGAYYLVGLILVPAEGGLTGRLGLALEVAGPAIVLDSLIGVPAMVLLIWLSRAISPPGWSSP
ncbi:MAG TPA: rod shape-determining protein MreD [Chloroflexota bacterium]|jgi:rod shape-determining protein MreD